MRRIMGFITVAVAVSALVWQSVQSGAPPTTASAPSPRSRPPRSKPRPPADRSADEAQIRANVAAFVKAFNAGDAKGVGALFTPDGRAVDKDGNASVGRDAIAQTFGQIFADAPRDRIEVFVDSITFLGPDLAEEVGTTKATPDPTEPPEYDRYTVLHVKRDGKWQMALARDEEGPPPTAHEQLRPLAWLVGDWVDDGGSAVVRSSCRWSEDGNFLLHDFTLQLNGKSAMNVTQRIGWDPVTKHVHAWVFDSEGGYGESTWTRDGDGWIIKATGVLPDGSTASATNLLTPAGPDGYVWRSADRIVGDERQPAVQVRVVRKPPDPEK